MQRLKRFTTKGIKKMLEEPILTFDAIRKKGGNPAFRPHGNANKIRAVWEGQARSKIDDEDDDENEYDCSDKTSAKNEDGDLEGGLITRLIVNSHSSYPNNRTRSRRRPRHRFLTVPAIQSGP